MSAYFAYQLIKNGIRKFDPDGFWSELFEGWGFPIWFRILVGFLETAGGVKLVVPRVRPIGAIIHCLVMLGALGTRLIHGAGHEDVLYLSSWSLVVYLWPATVKSRNQPRIKPSRISEILLQWINCHWLEVK